MQVCSDNFNNAAAGVVCRQVRREAKRVGSKLMPGPPSSPALLCTLRCRSWAWATRVLLCTEPARVKALASSFGLTGCPAGATRRGWRHVRMPVGASATGEWSAEQLQPRIAFMCPQVRAGELARGVPRPEPLPTAAHLAVGTRKMLA